MTDEVQQLQKRIEALERSNRRLFIATTVALILALLGKLIAIWAVTSRPRPEPVKPPERIASAGTYGNWVIVTGRGSGPVDRGLDFTRTRAGEL